MKKGKAIKEIDSLNKKAWTENRKNPELAMKLAKEALVMARKENYALGKAHAKHTMGAAHGWFSEFDKAKDLLGLAMQIFVAHEEMDCVADTTYTIGVVDYLRGDFKKSRINFHKSLEIYLTTKNLSGETNAYNGLGSAYTDIGSYDEAWDFLNKGLKLSKSIKETAIRPKIFDGLATLCSIRGEHDQAIEYFESSMKLNETGKNKNLQSFNLFGMGESYTMMKKFDDAKSCFEQSINIRKDLGFKVGEAQAEQSLGNVFLQLKDYKEAEKHLKYALNLSKKIDGKGTEMMASKSLAELYEATEQHKEFSLHIKNYYDIQRELLSEESEKKRFNELESANLNTRILGEIGQEIISSLELEKVLFTIYEKVNKLMDASVFGIGLYLPDENAIEYKLSVAKGKKYLPYKRDTTDKNQLAVWCIDKNEPVFINEFNIEYKNYIPEFNMETELEIVQKGGSSKLEQSILYVPITSGIEVIGVITVQSFEKNVYSKQDLDILKSIAVYASIGVINSRMYEALEDKVSLSEKIDEQHKELEKSHDNTRILNDIGREITMSLSISDVIEKVYKSINDLMDASVFSIGIYNKKKKALVFKGAIEKGKKLPEYQQGIKDENRMSIWCYLNQEECLIDDISKDYNKYNKDSKPLKASVGDVPDSAIFLPLSLKENHIGVLTIQSFKKNAYSKYQIDMLRNLAMNISSALENAMLYESMEDKVKQRTHEIEQSYQNTKVLGEIGMDIISTLELEKVLFTIYEKTNKLMDATVFGIGIYDADEKIIEYKLAIDRGEKYKPYKRDATDKTQFAVWCIDNKKPIFINDIEKEKFNYLKEHKTDTELGIHDPELASEKSLLYVPLMNGQDVIGVISVQSYEKNSYSEQDLDILQNLGIFLSTALVNAMLYESMEEKVKARTDEVVQQKEKAEKLMEKAEFEREEAKYQRKRAEQSERFKQQFLANMSHEIRTPMNAIMGMTNLLLEKNPPEQELPYLDSIKKSSESLLVIINDILDLSKIEAGKMVLEQTDFSLQETLRLVEQTMLYRADEKGLVISLNYDEDIPEVLVGDPVRLQQILMNITGNAVKFTEKGGVTIRVNLEGGMADGDFCKLRFEIRDTGIGMDREQQSKVFENFSQASTDTTRKYGGTGLGLSISTKLIELFGSTIRLESQPGVGSTFSFIISFPISKNKKATNKESEIPIDFIKELEGIHILLAEDNEYNQVVATETLELKIPGVQVSLATNGQEALDLVREKGEQFDVVLMDVQMPVMDGFDATRNIRKLDSDKVNTLPIIALTASVIKKDIQMCFDAGMVGFVPKPFKTSELIEAIYKAYKMEIGDQEIFDEPDVVENEIENRITSLVFLDEFTEGDQGRITKYVAMYLDSAEKNKPQLDLLLGEEKWDELKVLVHSMKPHFDFMGMKETRALAENIEGVLVEKKDMDVVPSKIEELKLAIEQSIIELKPS